jgi:hypothetical protein
MTTTVIEKEYCLFCVETQDEILRGKNKSRWRTTKERQEKEIQCENLKGNGNRVAGKESEQL